MASTWKNSVTGLTQRYGLDRTQPARVVEYTTDGPRRLTEIIVDQDLLSKWAPQSGGAAVWSADVTFPQGALIEDVEVEVHQAFDSANDTATLTVGLVDADDDTSNADADAFIATASVAELTPLGKIEDGTSPADGSARGTILAAPKHVTVTVGTQDFSAGRGTVRVYWSMPNKASDTLIQ